MTARGLTVGVNLAYLRPGQVGGSEIYVRSLVAHLAGRDGTRLVLFTSAEATPAFTEGSHVTVVPLGRRPFSQARRLVTESWGLAGALRRHPVDVLWSPANFAAVALPARVPQVVTIHDLQHLALPQFFTAAQRLARTVLMAASGRRCARVIAISRFTADDLVARGLAPAGKVVAILEGVDRLGPRDPAHVAATQAALRLPERFLYYPAMTAPHKNHGVLLEALALARATGVPDLALVLSGKRTPEWPGLLARADALGLGGAVSHTGWVDREALYDVMHLAAALAFPSRFEGFGLPPLEAMQCGTPVIAARAASLPEVVGDAGLLLDADDVAGWADASRRVARDAALRDDLVARGRTRVEAFSWDRCAAETLAVLRGAAR